MVPELLSQCQQQFRIGRLNGPWAWGRILRIQAAQIKTVVGLDQSDHHQSLPDNIDQGPGELNVIWQYSAERLTRIFAGLRLFSVEHECGLIRLAVTRESTFCRSIELAVVPGVVTGS